MSQATETIFNIKAIYISRVQLPVAEATKIVQNTLVCRNADGYIVEGDDAADLTYVGQAAETVDNLTGDDGDQVVQIYPPTDAQNRYMLIPAVSPTQDWLQELVFLASNQSVALAGSVTHDVCVGRVFAIDKTGTAGLVVVDTSDRSALVGP